MKGLTKKQERKFTQIFIGSMILHSHLDFDDEADKVSDDNMDSIMNLRIKEALKYLKDLPAFDSTDEVIRYVRENY